jgi:hypothetical protein
MFTYFKLARNCALPYCYQRNLSEEYEQQSYLFVFSISYQNLLVTYMF